MPDVKDIIRRDTQKVVRNTEVSRIQIRISYLLVLLKWRWTQASHFQHQHHQPPPILELKASSIYVVLIPSRSSPCTPKIKLVSFVPQNDRGSKAPGAPAVQAPTTVQSLLLPAHAHSGGGNWHWVWGGHRVWQAGAFL